MDDDAKVLFYIFGPNNVDKKIVEFFNKNVNEYDICCSLYLLKNLYENSKFSDYLGYGCLNIDIV